MSERLITPPEAQELAEKAQELANNRHGNRSERERSRRGRHVARKALAVFGGLTLSAGMLVGASKAAYWVGEQVGSGQSQPITLSTIRQARQKNEAKVDQTGSNMDAQKIVGVSDQSVGSSTSSF